MYHMEGTLIHLSLHHNIINARLLNVKIRCKIKFVYKVKNSNLSSSPGKAHSL